MELHPPDKGPGLPPETIPHLVGRAYGKSPDEVRDWPEEDVYRELLIVTAENAAQRKQMREAEHARSSTRHRRTG